jgi:hypothetical protein
MRVWAIGGAMLLTLLGTMPAQAESDFDREVLRRLERLERRMDDLERDQRRSGERGPSRVSSEPPQRREMVAAVSLLCGANCGMAAQPYCRQTGFRNGVAITIEKKGAFDHVTRARCFN